MERVRGWLSAGIEPHAIGVAARARWLADKASAALKAAEIPVVELAARSAKDSDHLYVSYSGAPSPFLGATSR